MKKFVEKKKIFFYIAAIIMIILIIVYSYFYSPKYENIIEENFLNEITIENNESVEKGEVEELEENLILIHIAGSVVEEGVIEIKENSRLIDVIEEAGGLTKEADLSNVNLAYTIKDGQKIYIPNKEDEEEIGVVMTDMPNCIIPENEGIEESNSLMVNINNATQTELEELTGIGPSIASNIIKYRKENGEFKSIEEVKNVEGIGESKYNKIKENICI